MVFAESIEANVLEASNENMPPLTISYERRVEERAAP